MDSLKRYRELYKHNLYILKYVHTYTHSFTAMRDLVCLKKTNNSTEQRPSWEANTYTVSQQILAFSGTRKFITVLIRARHWFLSSTRWL